MTLALAIVIAFLCGSIPFGLIIARAKGVDIRKHGSGNIGATNVGRVLGRKLGFICFALDVLKGLGPTLAFGVWAGYAGRWAIEPVDSWRWLAVMMAPVLGHVFCPWVGFKGGKGVATGLGALLGVFPVLTIAGAVAAVVWLVTLKVWRFVSLSSVLASASLPVVVLAIAAAAGGLSAGAAGRAVPYVVLTAALAVLVVIKHRPNLARLRSGTEPRVTWLGGSTGRAGGTAKPS